MLSSFVRRLDAAGAAATARANLIASENRQTPLVRSMLSSDAASRYSFAGEDGARGFPGGTNWAGFQAEGEAALCRLGAANYCNLRPLSGLHAMTVAILALSEPGDSLISLAPEDGGHYATGGLARRLGRRHATFRLSEDGQVDEENLEQGLSREKPSLVYVDQCHGLIPIDLGRIVRRVRAIGPGTLIHADVSHGLGLILGGVLENPLIEGCDSYGGSTHKTFPGPQKGVLLTNRTDCAERFAAAQFESISNHHLHASVALSMALLEFEHCGGAHYAGTIRPNAVLFAQTLERNGIKPVTIADRFTEWHQLWIADDALPNGAQAAASALYGTSIVVNLLPDLPRLRPLALRLGMSEITHLGVAPADIAELAEIVARTVHAGQAEPTLRRRVHEIIADAPRPFDYIAHLETDVDPAALIMPWREKGASAASPTILRGHGSFVEDAKGQRFLTAKSGALNAVVGYGREAIVEAARRQLSILPSNDATSSTNLPALRLARRIANLAGGKLRHTLFCNSGSEATETALKVAHNVSRARGRQAARRFISFEGGYHGCTTGALALAGFEFPKTDLDLIGGGLSRICPFPSKVEDLAPVRDALSGPGASDFAGVILEPVQGIGGIRPFAPDVLQALRTICDQSGVVLIFDEVFSGFGRTGKPFAFHHADVRPDILLGSKGLTGGYAALASVTLSTNVYDACFAGDALGVFRAGHTMSGNAAACAIALAVLDLIETDQLATNARQQGAWLMRALSQGIDRGRAEVRGLGLMIGLVLGDQDGAEAVVAHCQRNGILVRAQNGVVQVTPPMSIGPAAIERLAATLIEAANAICGETRVTT
ncbi:aminotransferase class III-fold pyridoxal phosphate-dependent enzyme [Mesorhizobium sp.]|uniref:aminotransferase class III-fold pyridoxal phosphate-dependent enzyme n=1 Tax=Mesorhizobium sp. TaxID=1871066 RepID=UPI00257BD3BF|nr:aminotransferase class III-fold pyridoxal phosphate-dependent enzyme [Mesorhizobium sp.]